MPPQRIVKTTEAENRHYYSIIQASRANLWVFLDKVTESINDGLCVDVIFLDFAKTFDKVLHQRLLCKLRVHGHDVHGKILQWISAWLMNRRQRD